MKLIVEVVGMKAFKGTIDNKEIDSGTLYSRVRLDARNNKVADKEANFKAGEAIEEWRMPSSAEVLAMRHLSVPFNCALEVERVSNGRETKDLVTGCTPVESSASVPVSPVRKVA